MIGFTELNWADVSMRGKPFGVRGNTSVYLKGRGPHVIHCRTELKPEQLIRLRVGSFIPGFGPQVKAVFSKDPNGLGVPLDFNMLFLSADGKDQWPMQGFAPGGGLSKQGNLRGANCALEPMTDYYFYLPEIVGGHESWDPQIDVTYQSSSSDDLENFPAPVVSPVVSTVDGAGVLDITIQGMPGKWVPNV